MLSFEIVAYFLKETTLQLTRLPLHHGHQRVPQRLFFSRQAQPTFPPRRAHPSLPPSQSPIKQRVEMVDRELECFLSFTPALSEQHVDYSFTRTDETDVFLLGPLSETDDPTISMLMVIFPPTNENRSPQSLCSLTRTPLQKTSRTPSLSAPLTSASTTTSRQFLRGKGCKPQHLPADKPVIARQLIRSDQTLHRR